MNTEQADTCHVIVRHPTAAKFLVIKHEERWSPPVLMFPPGSVDFKVMQINQGMKDKYGLSTRFLRPVMRLQNFHCVEMELAVAKSTKKIQAVWVDKAEYMRTRSDPGDVPDPIEIWLDEQESGKIPENRAPFHQPGWFAKADHWIHHQLDRLGIRVTGSVEQFRVGWSSSCLLRVASNQGKVFFKAGNEDRPIEASLTEALSQHYPDHVFKPLVTDDQRDWMLNLDYFGVGESVRQRIDKLPDFAAAMAAIQLDSATRMDRWKALGCRDYRLDALANFCHSPEAFESRMKEGGGALGSEEFDALKEALSETAGVCSELQSLGIPSTLVHPDFRDDNMVYSEASRYITDWDDTGIGHPFLVLGRIIQDHKRWTQGDVSERSTMQISDELMDQIRKAYLQPFSGFASEQDLTRGLELAQKLANLWYIVRTLPKVDREEVFSPGYYHYVVNLQKTARALIRANEG